jgi:hypothetical protein
VSTEQAAPVEQTARLQTAEAEQTARAEQSAPRGQSVPGEQIGPTEQTTSPKQVARPNLEDDAADAAPTPTEKIARKKTREDARCRQDAPQASHESRSARQHA